MLNPFTFAGLVFAGLVMMVSAGVKFPVQPPTFSQFFDGSTEEHSGYTKTSLNAAFFGDNYDASKECLSIEFYYRQMLLVPSYDNSKEFLLSQIQPAFLKVYNSIRAPRITLTTNGRIHVNYLAPSHQDCFIEAKERLTAPVTFDLEVQGNNVPFIWKQVRFQLCSNSEKNSAVIVLQLVEPGDDYSKAQAITDRKIRTIWYPNYAKLRLIHDLYIGGLPSFKDHSNTSSFVGEIGGFTLSLDATNLSSVTNAFANHPCHRLCHVLVPAENQEKCPLPFNNGCNENEKAASYVAVAPKFELVPETGYSYFNATHISEKSIAMRPLTLSYDEVHIFGWFRILDPP